MMQGRLYFDQASSIRSQTERMRVSPGFSGLLGLPPPAYSICPKL